MGSPADHFGAWRGWQEYLAGAEGENLAEVFSRVRVTGTDATQMRWARDWRTRAFCDLGLCLLYQHTMDRPTTMDPPVARIFARLQASTLTDTAAVLVEDPARAEALSVQRFNDTWGRQPAYCEELVSYLFRTGPYLRRLSRLHPDLLKMAHRMPLGECIRQSAVKELRSATADPLVAMHTLVEANLPSTTTVRQYVNRLRRARLQEWARLYELAFTAFHLEPREGIDCWESPNASPPSRAAPCCEPGPAIPWSSAKEERRRSPQSSYRRLWQGRRA